MTRPVCHPEERRITREARQRVDTKHSHAACHFDVRRKLHEKLDKDWNNVADLLAKISPYGEMTKMLKNNY